MVFRSGDDQGTTITAGDCSALHIPLDVCRRKSCSESECPSLYSSFSPKRTRQVIVNMTCVSQVEEVSNSSCRFLWNLDKLRTFDLEGKQLGKHTSSRLQRSLALMLGHPSPVMRSQIFTISSCSTVWAYAKPSLMTCVACALVPGLRAAMPSFLMLSTVFLLAA